MIVTVGRIGKAHGIRGSVTVQVLTDEPDRRFAVGSTMLTEPVGAFPLVVSDARWHSGRLLLDFEGVHDRTGAEALRGTLLQVEVDADERPDDPDEFYDHQLIGLPVTRVGGGLLGHVREISHLPSQDLVSVVPPAGDGTAQLADEASPQHDLLIPFVREIVVSVDTVAGLVVDPPQGLLPEADAPEADAPDADAPAAELP